MLGQHNKTRYECRILINDMLYASTRYLVAKVICRTKQRRAVESIELVYVRRTWMCIYIFISLYMQ